MDFLPGTILLSLFVLSMYDGTFASVWSFCKNTLIKWAI